jgi:effector-binding domain-containing protein
MNKKHLWWALAGIAGAAAAAAVLWGPIASQAERARDKTVRRARDIEIRDYTPMIVAEVAVSADRESALRQGFRTLADYIFGNNTAMGVIAMTAPVTTEGEAENWRVRFMMPARYTTDTLPRPIDPEVTLKQLEAKRIAAIRFSGSARDAGLSRHGERLEAFIRQNGLRAISAPAYAFYNPPWTLPFLRRNEVMIEIAQ